MIFGGWTLRGAVAGCLLFGAVDSFRLSLPTVGYEVTAEVLQALPFVVTIATVAVFAHRTRQPAALAQSVRTRSDLRLPRDPAGMGT